MKVILKKRENGKFVLLCVRSDGSLTQEKGVPSGGPDTIPHDLIHLIVETELGFTRGVFGLVASGMDLSELLSKDWKEKFKARGEMELLWSEAITATFQADRNPFIDDGKSIRDRLSGIGEGVPELTDGNIARIKKRIASMEEAWSAVPGDGKFEVEFTEKG